MCLQRVRSPCVHLFTSLRSMISFSRSPFFYPRHSALHLCSCMDAVSEGAGSNVCWVYASFSCFYFPQTLISSWLSVYVYRCGSNAYGLGNWTLALAPVRVCSSDCERIWPEQPCLECRAAGGGIQPWVLSFTGCGQPVFRVWGLPVLHWGHKWLGTLALPCPACFGSLLGGKSPSREAVVPAWGRRWLLGLHTASLATLWCVTCDCPPLPFLGGPHLYLGAARALWEPLLAELSPPAVGVVPWALTSFPVSVPFHRTECFTGASPEGVLRRFAGRRLICGPVSGRRGEMDVGQCLQLDVRFFISCLKGF